MLVVIDDKIPLKLRSATTLTARLSHRPNDDK